MQFRLFDTFIQLNLYFFYLLDRKGTGKCDIWWSSQCNFGRSEPI